jgi:hypothetical protein
MKAPGDRMKRHIDLAIEQLTTLHEPSRDVDALIALIMGWKPKDPSRSVQDGNVVWLRPDGSGERRIPAYTKYLDEAYELVEHICPTVKGGVSWERGAASAKLGDAAPVHSTTPQVALSLAAMLHLKAMTETQGS